MIHIAIHPEINKQFGQFLREARIKAGFSLSSVSRSLGLKSCQFLSNIERGLCSAPLYVISYLANQYRIDVEKIIKYAQELERINFQFYLNISKESEAIKEMTKLIQAKKVPHSGLVQKNCKKLQKKIKKFLILNT